MQGWRRRQRSLGTYIHRWAMSVPTSTSPDFGKTLRMGAYRSHSIDLELAATNVRTYLLMPHVRVRNNAFVVGQLSLIWLILNDDADQTLNCCQLSTNMVIVP